MRNYGNRGYIGIVLSVWFLLIITSIQSTVYGAGPNPIDVYREAGEIIGVVDHCKGNAGIVVYIPARSFSANVNPSDGSYKLNWVPPGVYSLCIAKNGEVIETINGVTVVKKSITDNGTTAICRDADGDTYFEDVDCNDSNPTANLSATEICNGVDDNCDGSTDEGGVCNFTGTWLISPTISYNCASGAVNYNFNSMNVTNANPTIVFSPIGNLDPLIGTITGNNFHAQNVIAGTCTETYTITGSFSGTNAFSANFDVQYTGICLDCTNQNWVVNGWR